MAREISLQDLIDKIKSDLFSPHNSETKNKHNTFPLFFVDQVEVELNISITDEIGSGIKLSIPQLVEASLDGKGSDNSTHTMKIVLKPILSAEQMRELVSKEENLLDGIKKASMDALRKGTDLAGEEE